MVFDGHCYVCSGWVRFLEPRQPTPPVELISMQSAAGRALFVEHGIEPDDPETFLVVDHGRVLTESDATIHVVSILGGTWRLTRILRVIPRRWRDAAYRLLAANRYHWFGKREVCYLARTSALPSIAEKSDRERR
jgi:predicted DCC family thiol-disulfide oxidoreductase YuxK